MGLGYRLGVLGPQSIVSRGLRWVSSARDRQLRNGLGVEWRAGSVRVQREIFGTSDSRTQYCKARMK